MSATMFSFLAILAFSQLLAIAWLYHKLSGAVDRLAKQTTAESDNSFRQIEALMSLYAEMRPQHGLAPTRGWAASPDFLAVLVRSVLTRKPMTIVECSSGMSTLVLASAVRNLGSGKVLSFEHDPIYAEHTRNLLRQHDLEGFAEVIHAPLKNLSLPGWSGQWYDTASIPENLSIDLLVVDGPPWFSADLARYPAYPVLQQQFASGAAIILDDASRESEKIIIEKWLTLTQTLVSAGSFECEKGCAILEVKHGSL